MSQSRQIGPRRYLASAKPQIDRPPLSFFRCVSCGAVLRGTLPEGSGCKLSCCGQNCEKLVPISAEAQSEGRTLSYDIVGGLNENCMRVFWQGKNPDWLYLETFTGGQQMFLKSKKRPPAVFALSGEDAYAYCDKDPCIKCSFRCKNGFVLYAYFEGEGLYSLPINQIAATPGSSASTTKMPPHNQ